MRAFPFTARVSRFDARARSCVRDRLDLAELGRVAASM
jgi:hypothetical protein